MESQVATWWNSLRAVALLNAFLWTVAAVRLRSLKKLKREERDLRFWLLVLAGGYVLGCGWRSFIPLFDVPRQCIVDSWVSAVAIGRTVATIAELCFVAQWALLLSASARAAGAPMASFTSQLLVPMIAVAECFSWYAVLTTNNLGHTLEETLWGLAAAILVLGFVEIWPKCTPAYRPRLLLWGASGAAYVAYMFAVDVPMYWRRYVHDSATGRAYMTVSEGFADASSRWVVSHRWADWQGEVVWMSLYFSVAVWLSIALVHAPLPERARKTKST